VDLDRKSWRERGMKALSPNDAVPRVKTRFTTFAPSASTSKSTPRQINGDSAPYCRAV
jgi:hypothetical protein